MGSQLEGSLDATAPADWYLKGKGNANLVFGYTGSELNLVGRVLRVRSGASSPASELERAVWGPVLGEREAEWEGGYVHRVLAPLLGAHHLPRQEHVTVSAALLAALLQGREEASQGRPAAILMPDATLLPADAAPLRLAGPPLCIEIKPKCGFAGACETVRPANRALKRGASRFQLHQALKLAQGAVGARSSYDPLDLFSAEAPRLRAALAALVAQPQNNLRAFLGGREVGVGELLAGGGAGGALPALAGDGQRQEALIRLLATVLEQEGVLPRLLEAQQQCPYDIEGMYRLYCKLTGTAPDRHGQAEEAAAAEEGAGAPHEEAIEQLLALPVGEAHALLRAYAVAATAKDCALMIALGRLAGGASPKAAPAAPEPALPPGLRLAVDPGTGERYVYRLTVVDLDMKRLAKLPEHHARDAAIVEAAKAEEAAQRQVQGQRQGG